MRNPTLILSVIISMCTLARGEPIRLHPENPHYFLYKGEPTILITSAEHYGAVLNLDFDYQRYLDTLAKDGMNYTRIFTGVYFENPKSFGIANNTLAPAPGRVITPWARSDTPGAQGGGNKFDLRKWNKDYFERIRDFVGHAAKRNVIVEVTLFTSIYNDGHWAQMPFNPANNVNDTRIDNRHNVHTLNNGNLWEHQERLVRKIVAELNPFDNVFFEIQNEPWSDQTVPSLVLNTYDRDSSKTWFKRVDLASDASLAWQKKVAQTIAGQEITLPKKHLIAQNYCNFKYPMRYVEPEISIMNFHYAWPDAAEWNYGWDRVIGFDESGFAGSQDHVYRRQAWNFILSGGGLFNNLDYSFVVGHEDGTYKNKAPGGGSPALRAQLKVLRDFMVSFEFIKLRPNASVVKRSPGAVARVLAEDGRQYAIYIDGGGQCDIELALWAGDYKAQWLSTQTGAVIGSEQVSHGGGTVTLASPQYEQDIALRILRQPM